MKLSKHAERRMEERGISSVDVQFLMLWGESVPQKGGAVVLRLSRRERKRAEKSLLRLLEYVRRDNSPYLVLENGQVVTVGHEYRRLGPALHDYRNKRVGS